MEILSPIDGDMLHSGDGITGEKGLQIKVTVKADAGNEIAVNGIPAQYTQDKLYIASVWLAQYVNKLEIINKTTNETEHIVVYWVKHFAGGYRLSIDDNIWFLKDIHTNQNTYKSIFDNPFLGFLKNLNDTYNTKVHLNLFYQTDGFNLSQLSDVFKDEWEAQRHWLRLSFHALQEFPDMPYKTAGYDEVKQDCEKVKKEIIRFAGSRLLGPVTTLHWGESTVEGSKALRDAGYKIQLGYFNVDDDLPPVSYYLSPAFRRHIKKRFIWKDNAEKIVFVRSSIVIDKTDLVNIARHLDAYKEKGGIPPYVDLLVHEQYYYPYYSAYQPDYCDRILAAVEWAHANGYTPRFLEESVY